MKSFDIYLTLFYYLISKFIAKLLAIEAQIAHSNNELKGAVQYISEALEIDSKNPVYYINRAYYHER